MPETVVVTGSGGRIGTILRRALAGPYELRGIDRVPTAGMPGATVASLTDFEAILPAARAVLGYAPRDNAERFRDR